MQTESLVREARRNWQSPRRGESVPFKMVPHVCPGSQKLDQAPGDELAAEGTFTEVSHRYTQALRRPSPSPVDAPIQILQSTPTTSRVSPNSSWRTVDVRDHFEPKGEPMAPSHPLLTRCGLHTPRDFIDAMARYHENLKDSAHRNGFRSIQDGSVPVEVCNETGSLERLLPRRTNYDISRLAWQTVMRHLGITGRNLTHTTDLR